MIESTFAPSAKNELGIKMSGILARSTESLTHKTNSSWSPGFPSANRRRAKCVEQWRYLCTTGPFIDWLICAWKHSRRNHLDSGKRQELPVPGTNENGGRKQRNSSRNFINALRKIEVSLNTSIAEYRSVTTHIPHVTLCHVPQCLTSLHFTTTTTVHW
jgi:hypothetical protein